MPTQRQHVGRVLKGLALAAGISLVLWLLIGSVVWSAFGHD